MSAPAQQRFTFFWRANSPFSQWHMGPPFSVDGVVFTSAEQAMMHGKAVLFGDYSVAHKILATNSPRKIKDLGRQVQGFKEDVWVANRELIVYRANAAKFAADEAARAALLATEGTELVEASPLDKIWGIGLAEEDPESLDPQKWRGLNLLGRVLTRLRDDIISAGRGGGGGGGGGGGSGTTAVAAEAADA